MAKTQTRRCISINRDDYEAAKQEAARRGLTLAALVEAGLAAIGVPTVTHAQQTPEVARRSSERRAENLATRRAQEVPPRRPSRERQLLGDAIADACGFA